MIECDECGTFFTPMTDAFRCPACGSENQEVHDDFSFTRCNVCGISIKTKDEIEMGMCDRCAAE